MIRSGSGQTCPHIQMHSPTELIDDTKASAEVKVGLHKDDVATVISVFLPQTIEDFYLFPVSSEWRTNQINSTTAH